MIDCIIKYLNLHLPSHLPTCQVFLQSHKCSLACYCADLLVKRRSRVMLLAQGNGRRTEKTLVCLGKHAERWSFPYDPVLFSLAVNFYRLKVNIFSVRRPQDKVTVVLFNHPRARICMQHAAGSYRCSMCQCNSYCENPVNWGKFLMTKAFSGHEALLPRGVLLSSIGLPSQAAVFMQMKVINCLAVNDGRGANSDFYFPQYWLQASNLLKSGYKPQLWKRPARVWGLTENVRGLLYRWEIVVSEGLIIAKMLL